MTSEKQKPHAIIKYSWLNYLEKLNTLAVLMLTGFLLHTEKNIPKKNYSHLLRLTLSFNSE